MSADCVTKETELLTNQGYIPIGALENKQVWVWNGAEYTGAMIRKTGRSESLVRVWFEDGSYLDCSEQHTFYKDDNTTTPAVGLRNGSKLLRYTHPQVQLAADLYVPTAEAYVAGFATFAGYEDNNRLALAVPDDIPEQMFKRLVTPSLDVASDALASQIRYEPKTIKAGYAPLRWRSLSRFAWLGGTLDAAGDWVEVDGEWFLAVGSTDEQLIRDMRRVALEIGFTPRIRLTDTLNAFMLPAHDADSLITHGFSLIHGMRPTQEFTAPAGIQQVVADVHPLPWKADVYCASETKRRRLVFNGILAGSGV